MVHGAAKATAGQRALLAGVVLAVLAASGCWGKVPMDLSNFQNEYACNDHVLLVR
jgi:hypothetical protein